MNMHNANLTRKNRIKLSYNRKLRKNTIFFQNFHRGYKKTASAQLAGSKNRKSKIFKKKEKERKRKINGLLELTNVD